MSRGSAAAGEDVAAGYRAATGKGAVFDRSQREDPAHRELLPVEGRAPSKMLTGIVSGGMPPDLVEVRPGVRRSEAPYSVILTPKGKVVTDLRLLRLGNGEAGGLLMDVPSAGLENLLDHLKRYLPPRFAKIVEPPEPLAMLTVTGSGAAAALGRELADGGLDASDLALAEGEELIVGGDATDASGVPAEGSSALRVVRNGDVHPLAFDLLGPAARIATLRERLIDAGLSEAGLETWETLRIEKGRPSYGIELDRDTLPPEAGIDPRAIDHHKGCYTGQEVIVRIRDRGRVNRHLRGFLLGDGPAPDPGTPLFVEGRERPAGEIRSAADSPRFGQTIALGYLRREAEPPAVARIGAADGPEVQVRALGDDGWEMVEGDPGRGAP